MKCPKCGYTSFDYLDSCKKCNNALGEFKAKYGLRSLLFPNRTQTNTPATPALAAAAAAPALAATADSGNSADFGYDFDSEPAAPATTPKVAAVAATDSFDFDTDWDAPSTPQANAAPLAQAEEDPFDFMSDSAETAPGFAVVGGELDLDLGEDPAPTTALAEEEAFEFDNSWGESTADAPMVAVAVTATEDAIPEFSAESFDFADSNEDDSLSFNDEFDFSDDELPDLLANAEESPATEKKLGAKEGPSDPFDRRESALIGLAPAGATRSEDIPENPPAPEPILDHYGDPIAADPPENAESAPFSEQLTTPPSAPPEVEPVAASEKHLTIPATELEQDSSLEPDRSELAPTPALNGPTPAGAPFFRLGAGAFDLLLLLLIYGLFLAAGKLALFPADQAMAPLPLEALADLAIPYFLILFALCFGYFTLFHFLSGQTPGKMIFRLKVESASGTPIDFAQAFLRSVGGLISLLCAGIGFLFILRSPEHRSWSDRLAGTQVIETTQPPTGRG